MTKRDIAKAQSRADALAAARELFTAHGYEVVTLRMIAKMAGVSTGGVLQHWPSKDALFGEAMGRPVITDAMGERLARMDRPYGYDVGLAIARAAALSK